MTNPSLSSEQLQEAPKRASFRYYFAIGLVIACGFLFCIGSFAAAFLQKLATPPRPTPDFGATLQVMISNMTPGPAETSSTFTPSPDGPSGQIVMTCQIYQRQSSEQICLMNADGTDYHRLTQEDTFRHFYPSFSPDGKSVVYSGYNPSSERFEIYEFNLFTREAKSLTFNFGDLNGPEISPDLKTIVFTRYLNDPNHPTLWLMDRTGGNFRQVTDISAWDPTWSPDGKKILFASDKDGQDQLYVVNINGSDLRKVSNLPALRGRSDWSAQDLIVTYSGEPWNRELYIMNIDGTNQRQISPSGGNSQGPSFSPDGKWIAFTAYFDKFNDNNGCEIYIMRVDGTDLRRLTKNDYCDYQPRWGQ